jgi:hypothetical protein
MTLIVLQRQSGHSTAKPAGPLDSALAGNNMLTLSSQKEHLKTDTAHSFSRCPHLVL